MEPRSCHMETRTDRPLHFKERSKVFMPGGVDARIGLDACFR